jgi:hypothetical protein
VDKLRLELNQLENGKVMVLQDEILLDLINELATVLNANIAIYGMNPCICTVHRPSKRRKKNIFLRECIRL